MEVIQDPDTGEISVEGYSEIWLARAMEIQGITLNAYSTEVDLVNVGVLIAVFGLHEMMHMKVEPFMRLGIRGGSSHRRTAGGIARTGRSIIDRVDWKLTAKVTDRNIELIRATSIDRSSSSKGPNSS